MEPPLSNATPRNDHALALAFLALAIVGLLMAAAFSFGTTRAGAVDLNTTVRVTICNDGIVSVGEACDFGRGNNIGGYASSTAARQCTPDCTSFGPYCGDGILQVRFGEQCDDGNNASGDLCSPTCIPVPPLPPAVSGSPSVGSIPPLPAIQGISDASRETRVVLRGKAFPNSIISVLVDGKEIGQARADSNADFVYATNQVTPGTATFGFVGRDQNGALSITTSVVFEVVQAAVTTVANIFIPPTLILSNRSVAPGDPLTLSGTTVPRAHVTIQIGATTSAMLESDADQLGRWALQIDTNSFTKGSHTAKASFKLSDLIKSGFGKSVTFVIGAAGKGAPSPDLNHDGKVNLVDFSIFLLSWNTDEVTTDFNLDGTTNLADFSIMLYQWTG